MKRCSFFKLAAAASLLIGCSSVLHAEVTYTIIDLGVIGPVQTDSASIGRAINASGEVTGNASSSNAGGDQRAFLYSGGVMHDLGTDSSGDLSYGYGINNAGVVVGTVEGSSAFYYANGMLHDIPPLTGGTEGGSANGINASGAIVGIFSVPGGNSIAFLYSGGVLTDLKDLQGDDSSSYSAAFAINDSGVIVGMCQILVPDSETGENNPVTKAMIYSGDKMTELPPLDQTTVATAYGINSAGEIVGASGGNAAIWSGGNVEAAPMVAGAQGSAAHGINDAGQIVGTYATKTFGVSHAFVCTGVGGVCHDLNDLATGGHLGGFEYLSIAYAINNGGTIVGEGFKPGPNGGVRGPFAFMAKPSVPTVVPPQAGVGMLTAAQNDPAPGFGSTTVPGVPVFSVAGPPAIDKSGDVAFHALIKETSKTVPVTSANNSGIWLYVGTVGSLIARTGDSTNPAPVTGNPLFTKLSDPVLSSAGDLAFVGTYAGGTPKVPATSAILVRKSGETNLTIASAVGDPAPVTGLSGISDVAFAGFEEVAVENGGGVAFLATVKGKGITAANNTGIWSTDSTGNLQLLALKGTPLPGISPATVATGLTAFKPLSPVSGQSRSTDTINGYGALVASAKSPSMLFFEAKRATAGGYTYSDPVTAGSAFSGLTLKSLEEPIVNDAGTLAFLAIVSGTGIKASDDLVLATMTNTTGSIITRTGDASLPAPDATTEGDLFSGLDHPVLNNGGSFAFIGSLAPGVGDTDKSGANGSGIWTNFGGTYKRLVRKGDPAPDTIGNYLAFKQLVLPDVGGPVFTASLSGVPAGQAQGLWATSSGVPSLILETGASLQVHTVTKTVRSFSLFQIPPLVMGQSRSFEATKGYLVYIATFTDGTWGIFSVVSS